MKLLTKTFTLAAVFAVSTSAHALSLIGDSITMTHEYPNLGTIEQTSTFVVQAGNADIFNYFDVYTANAEASSIEVDFLFVAGWTGSAFNGLVVSGINDAITGVSVSTNFSGWDNSRLSFDAHSVAANWSGLSFSPNTYFNMQLSSMPSSIPSVPDGGTTIAMLGLGLGGLGAVRCKLKLA
jgi:hypothetical protein